MAVERREWDAGSLRDVVRDYVVEYFGSPGAVLIADDTQVIKQGKMSVGVARQHCGLIGQVENCQVMPMLTYAPAAGAAFIDRRLYMPGARATSGERAQRPPARRAPLVACLKDLQAGYR